MSEITETVKLYVRHMSDVGFNDKIPVKSVFYTLADCLDYVNDENRETRRLARDVIRWETEFMWAFISALEKVQGEYVHD